MCHFISFVVSLSRRSLYVVLATPSPAARVREDVNLLPVSHSKSAMKWRHPQARPLRHNTTRQEYHLWPRLRNRQLNGYKFRRQHPIGPFVVDFCCLEKKLIVEVDDMRHLDPNTDSERTQFLESVGFKVLRFWNGEVATDTDAVLSKIRNEME